MGHMTVNQRSQYERVDLSVPTTGVQVRNRRRLIVFNVIALAIFGALAYATAIAIDGWAKGLVLAVIVLTAIGAMIALSPNRRS
jgi:fatty acid desaturase